MASSPVDGSCLKLNIRHNKLMLAVLLSLQGKGFRAAYEILRGMIKKALRGTQRDERSQAAAFLYPIINPPLFRGSREREKERERERERERGWSNR